MLDDKRRTVSVREAAAILGVGRDNLYSAIGRGEFPLAIRVGRRIVIGRQALMRMVDGDDE